MTATAAPDGPSATTPPVQGSGGPRGEIRDRALASGFDAVGFSRPDGGRARDLADWLAAGYHGDMGWMETTAERRASPAALWSGVRSVVSVAVNYAPPEDPTLLRDHPDRAMVSAYARGRDYHDVLKRNLRSLATWIAERFDCEVKLFVDTAPVMEKPAAQRGGLGWQGKHSNLVSRRFGSWTFLGEVFTALDIDADAPETDHCGACRRCLDACPTAAFPAPYRLDARRCISYLTIEHKGHIPREFRAPMGNRVYGCDDCLAVCPWNKFARPTEHAELRPHIHLTRPRLKDYAMLDDASFREVFSGSPIKRLGRDRFVRNVLIAIGNSGCTDLVPQAEALLADPSPLVRAMAVWGLARLLPAERFDRLRAERLERETDPDVIAEWTVG
jgi:epoxyqueuosine reductase